MKIMINTMIMIMVTTDIEVFLWNSENYVKGYFLSLSAMIRNCCLTFLSAKHGTLKLVQPDFRHPELQADYDRMRYMLYGNIPAFEQVMNCIATM